jgi:hypothetical protein
MSNDSTVSTTVITEDYESRITQLETLVSELTKTVSRKKRARDPVQHSQDELFRYYQKREEINARRRAAYKAKKTGTTTGAPVGVGV